MSLADKVTRLSEESFINFYGEKQLQSSPQKIPIDKIPRTVNLEQKENKTQRKKVPPVKAGGNNMQQKSTHEGIRH